MKKFLLMSLFLLSTLLHEAMAQDRTVTGRVTDAANNQGLPGVTVLVKGTQIGTATDVSGNYSISAPASGTTLVFSFVGYTTTERVIGNATTINIGLATDARQLGEVVVTALGVEREERALGYSATTVQSEDITRARATNPMNALQGKVAGVNISTSSGAPGASTRVVLRGYSSIGGNNNPLYVVDGVPINNGSTNLYGGTNVATRTQDFGNRANDINPDDIESVTILKGAAATSLYGSRAANGVILITTKKGKTGERVSVDIASSATVSSPLRLPQLQNTFGQGWSGRFDSQENGSWGPRLDGRERLWGNVVDNSQQLKPFTAQENNLSDFYDRGTSFLNTVSVSGGTEKSTFYLSYGNATEDGIIPTDADSYKRNTLALRGSTKGDKFSASSSLNFVRKDARVVTQGQGAEGATVFQEIIQIPRDMSIVDFRDINNKFNDISNYFTLYAQNPYFPLTQNRNDFEENRIFGNVNLDYKLRNWLTASARVGGDISNGSLKDWQAPWTYIPGSANSSNAIGPGRVDEINRNARELNGDLMLLSNNDLTTDLHLNGLIGYNINERSGKNTSVYVTNLELPGYYNLTNTTGQITGSTSESLRRLYGVYGQAELSYKSFLFLTLNARNDWSSTLPQGNNSFFYPGVNGSFVFTDVFTNLQGVLNYGKVRASWGQTGNDAGTYLINSVLVPGGVSLPFGTINFPIAGVNAYEVSNNIGNLSLQPEITTEYEFGANLSFLNNRIGADIAYYNRVTNAQILQAFLAPSSGYTTQTMNFGKVENKGFELLLTVTPIKTTNFNWDIRYTFSNNRNKVLELNEETTQLDISGAGAYGIDFLAIPGKPLGVFKGPDYARTADGRVIVNEANGMPQAAPDLVEYGDIQSKYLMGLYNTLNYKGLSLNFGFDIRKGGLMYSYTQRLTQFVGNTTNTLYNDRNPFIVPNSVNIVDENEDGIVDQDGEGTALYKENVTPIGLNDISAYWNDSNNQPIEREHMRDRSFVKLRELAIGYTLPTSLITRTPFTKANISLVGRNLFLWTPENNNIIDPETTTYGNDLSSEYGEFGSGPTVRTVGLSLNLGF